MLQHQHFRKKNNLVSSLSQSNSEKGILKHCLAMPIQLLFDFIKLIKFHLSHEEPKKFHDPENQG